MQKDLAQLIGESLGISKDVLESYKEILAGKGLLALPPTAKERTDKEIANIVTAYTGLKAQLDSRKVAEMGIYNPQELQTITAQLVQFRQIPLPHIYHKAVAQFLDQKIEDDVIAYIGKRSLLHHPEFASSDKQEQVAETLGKTYYQEYLSGIKKDSRLDRVLDSYLEFTRIPFPAEKLQDLGFYNDRDFIQLWRELKSLEFVKHPVSYQKNLSEILSGVTGDVAFVIGMKIEQLQGEQGFNKYSDKANVELTKMVGINYLVEKIKANAEVIKRALPMQQNQPKSRFIDLNDLHARTSQEEIRPEPLDYSKLDELFPVKPDEKSPPGIPPLPKQSDGGIILPGNLKQDDFDNLVNKLAQKRKKILGS